MRSVKMIAIWAVALVAAGSGTGVQAVSLNEAVDNLSLVFTTGGNAPWTDQTSVYYYGGNAAQSGVVADDQHTWMQASVTGPGILRFFWKVSSEANWDFLEFYINDIRQSRISGDVDWRQEEYSLSSGTQTVRWRYVKDGILSIGADAGWVDKVTLAADPGLITASCEYNAEACGQWCWPACQGASNNSASTWGSVGNTGRQEVDVSVTTHATHLEGQVRLFGVDGEWDEPPEYPAVSCGYAKGTISGTMRLEVESGWAAQVTLTIDQSGQRGDVEDYYLRILVDGTVRGNLNTTTGDQVSTVVPSGRDIVVEMMAFQEDLTPNAWLTSYDRSFFFKIAWDPVPSVACCLPGGACQDVATTECAALGGAQQGIGTSCALVICSAATVINRTSGRVFANVQAAIDEAVAGDELVLSEGTFTGSGNRDVDFKGKAITVRSADPANPTVVAATVIDCQQAGRGFHFHSGEAAGSVLSGVTITNGLAPQGGGIFCDGSSPTIQYCVIANNAAANGADGTEQSPDGQPGGNGGGMYCATANLAINHCTFSGNRAGDGGLGFFDWWSPFPFDSGSAGSGGHGGGIYAIGGSLAVSECVFAANSAGQGRTNAYNPYFGYGASGSTGGSGGGIYGAGDVRIADCTIMQNTAGRGGLADEYGGTGGSGGGIFCGGDLEVAGSVIVQNSAGHGTYTEAYGGPGGSGGGVFCSADVTIVHSALEQNAAGNGGDGVNYGGGRGGSGGGICSAGSIYIDHSSFTANHSGSGGGGATGLSGVDGGRGGDGGAIYGAAQMQIRNSSIAGNLAGAGGLGSRGGSGGRGGGLFSQGLLSLETCSFVGNQAGDGGYANYGDGFLGGGSGGGGGAILAASGLIAHNSFLENNSAGNGQQGNSEGGIGGHGGAIHSLGPTTLSHSVLKGNRCGVGGTSYELPGEDGRGRALYLTSSLLSTAESTVDGLSGVATGDGTISLVPDNHLAVGDELTLSQSSRVAGSGSLTIERSARLTLADSATIDFERDDWDSCATATTSLLQIDGELLAKATSVIRGANVRIGGLLTLQDSATLENSSVCVYEAEVQGANQIHNNILVLPQATTGFGGRLFLQDQAWVMHNRLISEGDRYLDLDPDAENQNLNIADNQIEVVIKPAVPEEQGTLLELRTLDHDYACDPARPETCVGAFPLASSPGFADTWALERLEIEANAKLNLANRPSFQFQTDTTHPETVYVKNLVLQPNAVLNTAYQRLYYQNLLDENGAPLGPAPPDPEEPASPNRVVMTNGSEIVNVPLLGFSLAIIAMNDETEFAVRVRSRVIDPEDEQPCECRGTCYPEMQPDPTTCLDLVGEVVQVKDTPVPGDGVMLMRNDDGSSVAAKGAFARAGEENLLVSFKYRFMDAGKAGDAEIVVKLSSMHEVGQGNYEVGRVRPPPSGEPGGVGSSEYALYCVEVPYQQWSPHLSGFVRGTYVELELRGEGAVVRIDDWDPQVICRYECASFDGVPGVSEADFLILLAKFGTSPLLTGHTCLDMWLSRDHHLDLSDLLSWETYIAGGLNSCGTGAAGISSQQPTGILSPARPSFPPGSLVVAGKSTGASQQDRVYTYDSSAGQLSVQDPWSLASAPVGYRGNGRLIGGGRGEVYQIHGSQGLIRSDGVVIIPPKSRDTGGLNWQGSSVSVGVTPMGGTNFTGVPLTDVVFDPEDANVAYVAPVLVWVASPAHTWRASAKLVLNPDQPGQYSLAAVYGTDPWVDALAAATSPPEASYTVTRLREVELDRNGRRLFVTSSRADNNNEWMLIYDTQPGGEVRHRLTTGSGTLVSPTAMLASARSDTLYLASADRSHSGRLHRLDISGSVPVYDGELLMPEAPQGHITQITSIAENPVTGQLYVLGFQMPIFDLTQQFSDSDPVFTTPLLLAVAPANPWSASTVEVVPFSETDLALPISILFLSSVAFAPADFNRDGRVNGSDLEIFIACANSPAVSYHSAALPPGCILVPDDRGVISADFDGDGHVDMNDFAEFQRAWYP